MKLDRRRLRRLIKEEYRKVLKEMYMGGGHMDGGMRGGSVGMGPDHPDYDTVGECISQVSRQIMFGQLKSIPAIESACREICMDYGVPEHTDYCISRAVNMARQMGML